MQIYRFPAPFVYSEDLPQHNEIKSLMMAEIEDDLELNGEDYVRTMGDEWHCDVISSYWRTAPLSFMTQKLYNTIVWQPLARCINTLMQDSSLGAPQNPQLEEFWYNRYAPGHFQEVHDHKVPGNRHTTYSGVYIVEMDEREVNPTTFYYENVPCHWHGGRAVQYRTEDVKEGSVLIFPSDLMHYVKPTKHQRTSISFNITTEV